MLECLLERFIFCSCNNKLAFDLLEKLEVEQKEFTNEIENEHGPCSISIQDGEITHIEKNEE